MFKAQILAKLVTKYPGLQKTFLGLIADKMATKVTEESGIDEAIIALDNAPLSITDLAADFQKEGDRRVTAAEAVWKKKNPPAKPPEKTEDTDEPPADAPPKGDDMPVWAKTLLTEVQTLKTEKAQSTIKQKLSAKFSEKGKEVPEVIWGKRKLPEKEEELDAFVTEVQTDWAALNKESTDKGLSLMGQPKAGSGGPAGEVKPASKEEIAALTKDIM